MEGILGINLPDFIRAIGLIGIFVIIFSESGLLLGFFLPGDSLLFTAGFLASQGFFNISILVLICFLAAISGDSFGYMLGKKIGPKIFTKEESLLFQKKNLERASNFYEKHGGKAIVLARFMPVVRTFAPTLAGVGRMKYTHFLFYNILGGGLWSVGLTLLGFWLGNIVPNVDRYIIPLIILIIFLSLLPPLFHILKDKEGRELMVTFLKSKFRKPVR